MKNERKLRLTLWEEYKSLKVIFQLFAAKLKKSRSKQKLLTHKLQNVHSKNNTKDKI
jgi:hypothetical protein